MNIPELVDDLYDAFAEKLGEPLASAARDLPRALRLAPERVPWSKVFTHELTLGAPALFADAMPGVPSAAIRDAVMAHALAVIDAFGTDRLQDGQIESTPAVLAVLGLARQERDRALVRLFGRKPVPTECRFGAIDADVTTLIERERSLLMSGHAVSIPEYERMSAVKQRPGVVASIALAMHAGWGELGCRTIRETLESAALSLQLYDDVVDWEEDFHRGGSWAVCLMQRTRERPASGERSDERPTMGVGVRRQVLHSGVLRVMLMRSLHHMRLARSRSWALGARRLSTWAEGRETRLKNVVAGETESAGYAVRAHALSAWATEVLA